MQLTRQQKALVVVLVLGGVALFIDRVVLPAPHSGPADAAAESFAVAAADPDPPVPLTSPASPVAPPSDALAANKAATAPAVQDDENPAGSRLADRLTRLTRSLHEADGGRGAHAHADPADPAATEARTAGKTASADAAGPAAASVRDAFAPGASWNPSPAHPEPAATPEPAAKPAKPAPEPATHVFARRHRLTAVLGRRDRGGVAVALVDGRPVRIGQAVDHFTLVEIHDRTAVFASPAGRVTLAIPNH